jgi:hypothetical protein
VVCLVGNISAAPANAVEHPVVHGVRVPDGRDGDRYTARLRLDTMIGGKREQRGTT